MSKHVFVYATCGYCEFGLKEFLTKINPNVEWSMKLPFGWKKPKKAYNDPRVIDSLVEFIMPDEINGWTGESIQRYIINQLKNKPYLFRECNVILLEDDTDARAENKPVEDFIQTSKDILCHNIREIMGKLPFDFYVLFAVPEIESWYIGDWENGFGSLDPYFVSIIGQYLRRNAPEQIEMYKPSRSGKLSENIINECNRLARGPEDQKNVYSKKRHGYSMLINLQPENVAHNCRIYFARFFEELRHI